MAGAPHLGGARAMTLSPVDLDPRRREQSAQELRADSCVHAAGIAAALAGSAYLILHTAQQGDAAKLPAVAIYAIGLLAMFGASAAYNLHYTSPRRAILRRCDHSAIFLMIAGTYTPFTTLMHSGWMAVALTCAVWVLCLAGIALKFGAPELFERLSDWLYLGLGWASIAVLAPLIGCVAPHCLAAAGLGGLLYTVGVFFHRWERLRFQNAIWHVFVLCAAGAHYFAVLTGVVLTGV